MGYCTQIGVKHSQTLLVDKLPKETKGDPNAEFISGGIKQKRKHKLAVLGDLYNEDIHVVTKMFTILHFGSENKQ